MRVIPTENKAAEWRWSGSSRGRRTVRLFNRSFLTSYKSPIGFRTLVMSSLFLTAFTVVMPFPCQAHRSGSRSCNRHSHSMHNMWNTHTHKNSHIQGIQMKTNLPKLISIKWHRNAFHKIQHRILNTIPKLLDKSTQNPFCLLTGRGRSLFHRLLNPASLHRTNIWDLMQHYILMLVLHLFFFLISSLKKKSLLTLTSSLSRGYKKLQKKVFVQQQHKNI